MSGVLKLDTVGSGLAFTWFACFFSPLDAVVVDDVAGLPFVSAFDFFRFFVAVARELFEDDTDELSLALVAALFPDFFDFVIALLEASIAPVGLLPIEPVDRTPVISLDTVVFFLGSSDASSAAFRCCLAQRQALHLERIFLCSQIDPPPQSLHTDLMRLCTQIEPPPHILH